MNKNTLLNQNYICPIGADGIQDPLLGTEGLDYDGGILGLRWDFNPYATLKAEYRNEEFDNGGRENNFRLQVSFVLTKM